jgi:hypothetical protein
MKKIVLGAMGLFLISGGNVFAEESFLENCEQLESSNYKICTGENSGVFYDDEKVEGADGESFEILKYSNIEDRCFDVNYSNAFEYAKDKNSIYRNGEILNIKDADLKTFQVLNRKYSKDKNFVYFKGKKLEKIDSLSFEIIDNTGYERVPTLAKDKNFVYFNNIKLEDLNSNNTKVLKKVGYYENIWFIADNKNVYINDKKIENADRDSFFVYEGDENQFTTYSFDKNSVFYAENKISNSDPKTFEFIDANYQKDKNNYYEKGKIIPFGELPEEIQEREKEGCKKINEYFICEKKVYAGILEIKGVDPNTFEAMEELYAKDKNNIYHRGEALTNNADPKSFRIIDHRYTSDKKNVYYFDTKLPGVDPLTFSKISHYYIRDKNTIYFENNSLRSSDKTTREKFVNTLWGLDGIYEYPYSKNIFSDTNSSYISFLKDKQIISSNPENKFYPDRTINFAEASKILVNTFFEITPEKKADDWWSPFVEKLEKEGIKIFPPEKELTGDDMVDLFLDVLEWKEQQKKMGE